MVDVQQTHTPSLTVGALNLKQIGLLAAAFVVAIITIAQAIIISRLTVDDSLFVDSTLGELAVWMADQATEDEPEAFLASVAQSRMATVGEDALENALLADMQQILSVWAIAAAALAVIGGLGLAFNVAGHRLALLAAMMTTNILIYVIPPTPGSHSVSLILVTVTLIGLLLLLENDHVERYIGFIVVLSFFTVVWEGSKAFANAVGYNITVPADEWTYTPYNDLDMALAALQSGEVGAIMADRNQLDELMPPYPPEDEIDTSALSYPELSYLTNFERERQQFGREVTPELARRVASSDNHRKRSPNPNIQRNCRVCRLGAVDRFISS